MTEQRTIDPSDLVSALTNQRNAAMQEAAMNYALALGYERKIKDLEEQIAARDNAPPQSPIG